MSAVVFVLSGFVFAVGCAGSGERGNSGGGGSGGTGGSGWADGVDGARSGGEWGGGGGGGGRPSSSLRSAAVGLDRRVGLIEPILGRVRAEPGSTVLVPVRLTGAVDAREPIRLMVLRPMDRSASAQAAGGTAVDADSEQGVAFATLHRWSVSGISDVQPSGAAGVGRGGFDVEAARWLGLTGVWSVSSVGLNGVGGGGRGGGVGADLTDGRVGGWLLAINVPWREDQERSRLELVFPEVLLEVRGLTPRSRSLDRLREDLTGPPPGFDGQSKSGVDLLRVLRSWPTERWRATLLTLDAPAHINNRATWAANDAQQNPAEREDVASLNRPAGVDAAVLEALSQQIESSWLAALALVSRDDPVLATRLRDRLVLCVRGVDGASSIPAWPTDTDMLDRLLDDLLNDAMPTHWRQERARGWLELQPSVSAWVRSDAYAISGIERHPVSELMIAALSPTAGSFAGSRAGTSVAPAVLTLRSRIGDGTSVAIGGGVGEVGGASGGRDVAAGQVGASFIALEYAQLVSAEVELWPTDRAVVIAGGVGVAGRASPRTGDEDLAVGGVEGRAARAAMDAGIGDIVELTSGEWSMSRRAWGRAFPVLRPGVTLGPWRAEARLGSWMAESIGPNDDRAVELGFGPVSGIAGLPGRTGASAGAAGTVGNRSVQDPGWVTAARIYRDPQRESASGWVVYVECRGVGDDTGARGESQRASVVRADTVRVIFGPGAGASHVVAVTEHGVEASFHVPTSRSQQREATVVRHADGWSAWIDVPESAIDPQGILRIAFERVDARGVRSTWPRTCTPWCEDPGRASLDLRAWGEEPNVSTTNTEPGVR